MHGVQQLLVCEQRRLGGERVVRGVCQQVLSAAQQGGVLHVQAVWCVCGQGGVHVCGGGGSQGQMRCVGRGRVGRGGRGGDREVRGNRGGHVCGCCVAEGAV